MSDRSARLSKEARDEMRAYLADTEPDHRNTGEVLLDALDEAEVEIERLRRPAMGDRDDLIRTISEVDTYLCDTPDPDSQYRDIADAILARFTVSPR